MSEVIEDKPVAAPAEKKSKKSERPTASVRGMVMYADGGARPTNPGFAGSGVHGYIADTAGTIKGCGLGSTVASTFGYVPKTETESPEGRDEAWFLKRIEDGKPVMVMPESYVDIVAVAGLCVTNNAAEMNGALLAMEIFEEMQKKTEPGKELKYLQIRSDSQYTCKGMDGWMNRWAANGWVRPDGSPISNIPLWQKIRETYHRIKESGVIVKIDWIRGHSGDVGNERTDKLATIGVMHAMKNKEEGWRLDTFSPADGYWKIDNERHPFLAHRYVYFNTLQGASVKGTYYLGNHGKDEELLGNRMSDGSFAVVRMDESDEAIDYIRELQARYSNNSDSLFSVNLPNLFNPEVTHFMNTYGELGVQPPNGYRLDLSFVGNIPLTRDYQPARISMRAVDVLEELERRLTDYLDGKDTIKSTDITSKLFELTEKKEKGVDVTVYKLRPEINVGLAFLEVDINHPLAAEASTYKLKLTMGSDLLARNSLKRLESLKPEVHVITWAESEKAFRYATVVKAQGCVGIWAGYYSNLRLLA